MALTGEELQGALKRALEPRPEVLEAYLFGSKAKGTGAPHSDVDVAVYLADAVPDAPFGYESSLATDLIGALGDDRVDVVVLNRAPPLLYHRVLRDGVRILSRDPKATTAREGRALSRYCDWVPQLAKADRAPRPHRAWGLRPMSLGELGVVPAEFAQRFRAIAGFRNVLVHGYLEVDPAVVHRVLNERLEDFPPFARYVEAFLARPPRR